MHRKKNMKKIIVFMLCLAQVGNINAITLQQIQASTSKNKNADYSLYESDTVSGKIEEREEEEAKDTDVDGYYPEKDDVDLNKDEKEDVSFSEPVVTLNNETGILTTEYNGERISSLFYVTITEEESKDLNNVLTKSLARAYNIDTKEELNVFVKGNLDSNGLNFVTLYTESGISQVIFVNVVKEFNTQILFESTTPEERRGGLTNSEINNIIYDNTNNTRGFVISEDGRSMMSSFDEPWGGPMFFNAGHFGIRLPYSLIYEVELSPIQEREFNPDEFIATALDEFLNTFSFDLIATLHDGFSSGVLRLTHGYVYGDASNWINDNRVPIEGAQSLNSEQLLELVEIDFGQRGFVDQAGYVNYGVMYFDFTKLDGITQAHVGTNRAFVIFRQPVMSDEQEQNFESRITHNPNGFQITLDTIEEWKNQYNIDEIREKIIAEANIQASVWQGDAELENAEINLIIENEDIQNFLNAGPGVFRLDITTSNEFTATDIENGVISENHIAQITMPIDIRIGNNNERESIVNSQNPIPLLSGGHSIVIDYNDIKHLEDSTPTWVDGATEDMRVLYTMILEFSKAYSRTVTENLLYSTTQDEFEIIFSHSQLHEIINGRIDYYSGFNIINNFWIIPTHIGIGQPSIFIDVVVADATRPNIDIATNNEAWISAQNFVISMYELDELITSGTIEQELIQGSRLVAQDLRRNINLVEQGLVDIDYSKLSEALDNEEAGLYDVAFTVNAGRFQGLTSTIQVNVRERGDIEFPETNVLLRANNFYVNIDSEGAADLFDGGYLKQDVIEDLSNAEILNLNDLTQNETLNIELVDDYDEVPNEVGVYEVRLTIDNPVGTDEGLFKPIWVTIYDDNSVHNKYNEELLLGNGFLIGVGDAQNLDKAKFLNSDHSNARAYSTANGGTLDINVYEVINDSSYRIIDFDTYEWSEGRHNIYLRTESEHTRKPITVVVSDNINSSPDTEVKLYTKSFAISEERFKELIDEDNGAYLEATILKLAQAEGFSITNQEARIIKTVHSDSLQAIKDFNVESRVALPLNILAQNDTNNDAPNGIASSLGNLEMWVVPSPGTLTPAPGDFGHVAGANQEVVLANHFIIDIEDFSANQLTDTEIINNGNIDAFEVVGPTRNLDVDFQITGSITNSRGVQSINLNTETSRNNTTVRAIVTDGGPNEVVNNGMYINADNIVLTVSEALAISSVQNLNTEINSTGGSFTAGVIPVEIENFEYFTNNIRTGETIQLDLKVTQGSSYISTNSYVSIVSDDAEIEGNLVLDAQDFWVSVSEVEGLLSDDENIIASANARAFDINNPNNLFEIGIDSKNIEASPGNYLVTFIISDASAQSNTLSKAITVTVTSDDINWDEGRNIGIIGNSFAIYEKDLINEYGGYLSQSDIINLSNSEGFFGEAIDLNPEIINITVENSYPITDEGSYTAVLRASYINYPNVNLNVTKEIDILVVGEYGRISDDIQDTNNPGRVQQEVVLANPIKMNKTQIGSVDENAILVASGVEAYNLSSRGKEDILDDNVNVINISTIEAIEEVGVYAVNLELTSTQNLLLNIPLTVIHDNDLVNAINDNIYLTARNIVIKSSEAENLTIQGLKNILDGQDYPYKPLAFNRRTLPIENGNRVDVNIDKAFLVAEGLLDSISSTNLNIDENTEQFELKLYSQIGTDTLTRVERDIIVQILPDDANIEGNLYFSSEIFKVPLYIRKDIDNSMKSLDIAEVKELANIRSGYILSEGIEVRDFNIDINLDAINSIIEGSAEDLANARGVYEIPITVSAQINVSDETLEASEFVTLFVGDIEGNPLTNEAINNEYFMFATYEGFLNPVLNVLDFKVLDFDDLIQKGNIKVFERNSATEIASPNFEKIYISPRGETGDGVFIEPEGTVEGSGLNLDFTEELKEFRVRYYLGDNFYVYEYIVILRNGVTEGIYISGSSFKLDLNRAINKGSEYIMELILDKSNSRVYDIGNGQVLIKEPELTSFDLRGGKSFDTWEDLTENTEFKRNDIIDITFAYEDEESVKSMILLYEDILPDPIYNINNNMLSESIYNLDRYNESIWAQNPKYIAQVIPQIDTRTRDYRSSEDDFQVGLGVYNTQISDYFVYTYKGEKYFIPVLSIGLSEVPKNGILDKNFILNKLSDETINVEGDPLHGVPHIITSGYRLEASRVQTEIISEPIVVEKPGVHLVTFQSNLGSATSYVAGLNAPNEIIAQTIIHVYDDTSDIPEIDLVILANNFTILTSEFEVNTLSDSEIIRRSSARVFLDGQPLQNPNITVIGNVKSDAAVYDVTLQVEINDKTAEKPIKVEVKKDNNEPNPPETPDPGPGNTGPGRPWGRPPSSINVPNNVKVIHTPQINQTLRHEVEMVIGSTKMLVNGFSREMDVAPYIQNNRTMVPVRFLSYGFFIPAQNIIWDESKRLVTIIDGTTTIEITVGEEIMYVNGVPVRLGESDLDTAVSEIKNDRVFVPIRPIAEALNVNLEWIEEIETVKFYREIEI